jgi:hypothetical protein
MNHKKYLILLGLSALVLGGCFHVSQTPTGDVESINQTLSGTLGPANESGDYLLQTSEGSRLVHDGNALLSPYVGQTVRLTGQYSGTTLYVDLVEIVQ